MSCPANDIVSLRNLQDSGTKFQVPVLRPSGYANQAPLEKRRRQGLADEEFITADRQAEH
jgi:hypothetical protein